MFRRLDIWHAIDIGHETYDLGCLHAATCCMTQLSCNMSRCVTHHVLPCKPTLKEHSLAED